MNKKRLYWTIQFSAWFLYGLIQVIGANLVAGDKALQWIDYVPLIIETIYFLLATHFLRNLIIQRGWLLMGMPALIPRVILLAVMVGMLALGIRIAAISIVDEFQPNLFNFSNIVGNVVANTLIVFLWSVFYFIYHYFENYNKTLKYQAAIHEIELNNLKSQLNPHFMFNALNSIRAMVDDEPDKSKVAITQLSNILRNSLATDKKKLTSFNHELGMVKDYLSLEKIRYEERLTIDYDLHPDSFRFFVPPLMIQTLVENGIKHGISKLKEGGFIKIRTTLLNGSLNLQIRNSGQLKNGAPYKSKGLGLRNTIKRLDLIYGDEASFKIYNEKNSIVVTEIVIPEKAEL